MSLKYFVLFLTLCPQAFCSQKDFEKSSMQGQGDLAQFIQRCNEQCERQVAFKKQFRKLYLQLLPYELRAESLGEHTAELRKKAEDLGLELPEMQQRKEDAN